MNFTKLALYRFIIIIIVIIHIIIINNNSTLCAIAVHLYFPRNYLWPQRYQDAKPFNCVQLGPAYQNIFCTNGPIYRYGGHIEFIRFKEYYVMPRGHSLSIYARFSGKKRALMYISREIRDHYYIQTWHNDLFPHYNLFLEKFIEKLARKARVNTDAGISHFGVA